MLVRDNLSGESIGGSLVGPADTGGMLDNMEHSNRVATLRRQPPLMQGKGDRQSLEESIGALAYREGRQEWWPF